MNHTRAACRKSNVFDIANVKYVVRMTPPRPPPKWSQGRKTQRRADGKSEFGRARVALQINTTLIEIAALLREDRGSLNEFPGFVRKERAQFLQLIDGQQADVPVSEFMWIVGLLRDHV